jgi:hypothetical protein
MIKNSCYSAIWCILSCLPQYACASPPSGQESEGIPMVNGPSVAIYALTGAELQFHKPRAVAGDLVSAYCVAMHFWYLDIENPEARYWITIAAENGDSSAMQMVSLLLGAKNNPQDMSRSKYWKDRGRKITDPPPSQTQCHRTTD